MKNLNYYTEEAKKSLKIQKTMIKYNKYNSEEKIEDMLLYKLTPSTLIVEYKGGKRELKIVEKGQKYNHVYKLLKSQINIQSFDKFREYVKKSDNLKSDYIVFNSMTFNLLKDIIN